MGPPAALGLWPDGAASPADLRCWAGLGSDKYTDRIKERERCKQTN